MESGTKLMDRDKLSEELPQRYEEPLIRVNFGSNVRCTMLSSVTPRVKLKLCLKLCLTRAKRAFEGGDL